MKVAKRFEGQVQQPGILLKNTLWKEQKIQAHVPPASSEVNNLIEIIGLSNPII
jgi:hypothetical protein